VPISRRDLLAVSTALPAAAPGQSLTNKVAHVDILRTPDSVTAFVDRRTLPLRHEGSRWTASGIAIYAEPQQGNIPLRIEAATLSRVRLRWRAKIPESWRILSDAWERSYGDLEWRCLSGDRVLPWYFLAFDGQATNAYGVRTGAAAFAFWQVDPDGISLWLDVRNGGSAVQLGGRLLDAVTITSYRGAGGESSFAAAQQFCRELCNSPHVPAEPVYGGNNWYYAYGKNCSAADILRDTALITELAPAGTNRPFMVIDDGWTPVNTTGPWDRGNERFPDMPGLAASIKKHAVRPGIWLRPLLTRVAVPESARLRFAPGSRDSLLDPTVPENLETVRNDIRRVSDWGFELIKHDYTSFDLMGRWGFRMGAELTDPGWHFADRTRTTAEITLALYRAIREAAGDALIIGCNTFGHLGAGIFELQRTGDDTSGTDFDRTRRMGVNTLAFRMPQHKAFFDLHADCAPVTPNVPWDLASKWLDLVANSGTALFVSPDPKALTPQSREAIRRAFAAASKPQASAEAIDWMENTTPAHWRIGAKSTEFDWYPPDGGSPFPE
jgi:alpha-galactosidase